MSSSRGLVEGLVLLRAVPVASLLLFQSPFRYRVLRTADLMCEFNVRSWIEKKTTQVQLEILDPRLLLPVFPVEAQTVKYS